MKARREHADAVREAARAANALERFEEQGVSNLAAIITLLCMLARVGEMRQR